MYTVAVVTGTRAEYGLLRPVLGRLAQSSCLRPRLLVTGAHLSEAHGRTVQEIEADGFEIAARLDILSQRVPEGRAGTAARTRLALALFGEWLAAPQNRPDALLLLGDRYEAFAAGQAAALLDIPVVHISGGDVTTGADDDWFRHCLTKMAKLHFPSCEVYRRRVIRMGEQPDSVFNVGGLGDENIRGMRFLSKKTLSGSIGVNLERPYALVTLHPETVSAMDAGQQADALLAAMDAVEGIFWLLTGANADAGGDVINEKLRDYAHRNPGRAAFFASLGSLRYLTAMRHATLVLGNSSSGVVETPTLGVPAVDIGNRQAGRVTGENVIHCPMRADDIAWAIGQATAPTFMQRAHAAKSPYNGGDTSGRIAAILEEFLQDGRLLGPKIFYDGEEGP